MLTGSLCQVSIKGTHQWKRSLFIFHSNEHVLTGCYYRASTGHHVLSVYPKKELPFFILFTAGLCSFTAILALLTHQFPEPMANLARTVSISKVFLYLMI